MYQLKPIGTVESGKEEITISIHKNFQKALKHLDKFSHIHLFFITEDHETEKMRRVIVKIKEVNINKGFIIAAAKLDLRGEAVLIDIKPYFPCEDTVKNPVYSKSKQQDFIEVKREEGANSYEVNAIGEIRKVKGTNYIQLEHMIKITGSYITVFWWFHKFDAAMYRGVTECNPPYENAPRSGIFATRSPVRPNPVAMTVARILRIEEEKKRIYLEEIESFDKTPCLGISEYNSREDCTWDCKTPVWLEHWPKYIKDTTQSVKNGEITMIDSGLKELLYEKDNRKGRMLEETPAPKVEIRRQKEIGVYGARENNLKGMNVHIPYGKITAVVGVSGSGKSSLVHNTVYAECRRRMEYLSHSYHILQKPKVDEMAGCLPAVVISQGAIHGNALSTVGTYSDAYDYLRNIYAAIAVRHCPSCKNEIIPLSKERIVSLLKRQKSVGIYDLSNNRIEGGSLESRIEIALEQGAGAFYATLDQKESVLLQTKQKCYHCNKLMFEMTPSTFSYMDGESRCPVCNGTGKDFLLEESKVIDHPELSLLDGAASFYGKLRAFRENSNANWMKGQVFGLAAAMDIDLEKPWCELPIAFRDTLLRGSREEVTFSYHNKKNGRRGEIKRPVEGLFTILERISEENPNTKILEQYMSKVTCKACGGERLSMEGRLAAIHHIRYPEAAKMTFYEIIEFCDTLKDSLDHREYEKIENAVRSLIDIAKTAISLGIGYIQLNQETCTLSGGEGQRLKLLGAFKNHISGILYIFDEPSKGLHPRDYEKIIGLLKELAEEGNTIILVEHNEDMIRIADYILEIGPGAGENGGRLIGEGTLAEMLKQEGTQISKYMRPEVQSEFLLEKNTSLQLNRIKMEHLACDQSKMEHLSDERIKVEQLACDRSRMVYLTHERIKMKHLTCNNLKNISIEFPQKALTCICGVSGSGKSSLMKGEIYSRAKTGKEFTEVIMVDQLPIGKTSKSIVATYIGIMDFIRSEFAAVEAAVQQGWDEKYFSFNSQLGQCETCLGEGKVKVKYMEGAFLQCPDCNGKRYKKMILQVFYRGKSIDEILDMSVTEALQFLLQAGDMIQELKALQKVGLGYLKLGQGTATLSGGEAARLKLAKELITKKRGSILYLLDEPTTGLHFSDICNLLKLIDELIRGGNTVIAIEHNKQFLKHCDWKIELGPGAGKDGGNIISQGKGE